MKRTCSLRKQSVLCKERKKAQLVSADRIPAVPFEFFTVSFLCQGLNTLRTELLPASVSAPVLQTY